MGDRQQQQSPKARGGPVGTKMAATRTRTRADGSLTGLAAQAEVSGVVSRLAAMQRHAKEMPAARAALPPGGPVVQRVRGGLEYTEDTSELNAFPKADFTDDNVDAYRQFAVGDGNMTSFRVGPGKGDNANLGDATNEDLDVVKASPHVRLTNDVHSAEWIVERHKDDVPADIMKANLRADIKTIFDARSQLVSATNSAQHGAGEAAVAEGTHGNLNDIQAGEAQGAFIYSPGANKGKAQITAQYTEEDTIRRINKLNVSKFLTGTKVAEGEDLSRISGTQSDALRQADIRGTTSFSTAERLLASLITTSNPIASGFGGERLTTLQVATVKLMVINDALATAMVRYRDDVGQGEQKNLQRFFPKSRRDAYVRALAKHVVSQSEMDDLRAEIKRTSAADAQLVYNSADAGALRVDEAFNELADDPTTTAADIMNVVRTREQLAGVQAGVPTQAELDRIKTMVLGANGASLAGRIDLAAEAYTDLTIDDTEPERNLPEEHEFYDAAKPHPEDPAGMDPATYPPGGLVGKVIETSRGFTPVAGAGGAIYEMREREVAIDKSGRFNFGSLDEVNDAIDKIFGSAGDSP